MFDQAAIFLIGSWKKARDIDKGDDGDTEGIAKADEPRRLSRRIAVKNAGEHHRLVRDKTHSASRDAAEAYDDIFCVSLRKFEKIALVRDFQDQFLDVIGLVRVVGNKRIERLVDALVPDNPNKPYDVKELRSEEHTSELQ